MMIGVGIIFSGKAVVSTNTQSSAESAGAAIGGGFFALLTGGVSIFMAIVCMIGFTVFYLIGREFKDEVEKKKCPECAEKVNIQAKKCKHCGSVFEEVTELAA